MTAILPEGGQLMHGYVSLWGSEFSTWWVVAQQPTSVPHISLGGLVALALSPFLIFGFVSFVVESVFGGREITAAGGAGALLVGLAIIAPADLNRAVAVAIWQELGWRIGFEVARPVAVYWGVVGVLVLLGVYGERQESTNE